MVNGCGLLISGINKEGDIEEKVTVLIEAGSLCLGKEPIEVNEQEVEIAKEYGEDNKKAWMLEGCS